jgi:hypothetical protein
MPLLQDSIWAWDRYRSQGQINKLGLMDVPGMSKLVSLAQDELDDHWLQAQQGSWALRCFLMLSWMFGFLARGWVNHLWNYTKHQGDEQKEQKPMAEPVPEVTGSETQTDGPMPRLRSESMFRTKCGDRLHYTKRCRSLTNSIEIYEMQVCGICIAAKIRQQGLQEFYG